ncbi:MAG: phosphoglucosamine mutase [Clostridiales Family XIII bacterium]|nr:phosphoglucosamine mutase [Clostridiales Family XIII bacterium]
MARLFGTDGVRGIANKELTAALAYDLGVAGGFVLGENIRGKRPVVVIGKDTRLSGDMLEDALSAGLLAMGCDVVRIGVIPTPGIAYLTQDMGASAGVVISASHNTFEYNGIKFFNSEGFKLADELEDEIEEIVISGRDVNSHITGALVGRVIEKTDDALHRYSDFLAATVKHDISDMKIVVDCANGAAYRTAKRVFKHLNANIIAIGDKPDGLNINEESGSTHPENLQKRVIKEGADLGLAFDGDADRLIACDEKGELVDGDKLMFICAKQMKAEGLLENNLLTATSMSNLGLAEALANNGIELQRADVGDRYVLEMMKKTGSVLGGEQSGHIIFLRENTTGDGIFAALRLIEAIKLSGAKASELSSEVKIYPQVLKGAAVKNENKYNYDKDEKICAAIDKVVADMDGKGRVLIRPSGTEPLVRVMLEGSNEKELNKLADGLVKLIESRLR